MDKSELFGIFFTSEIDKWTLAVAFLIVVLKIAIRWYKGHSPYISQNACMTDLLNGAVIVPFAGMVVAVFSPTLMMYVHTGPLLNGLAGAIGLIFVIGEILSLPSKSREETKG